MDDFCLYNNVHIPSVGFGTWHIKDRDTIEASIISAINLGYKHIDTASKYKNEEFIGDTLKKYNIPRKNLFITSKVWNDDKGYYINCSHLYKMVYTKYCIALTKINTL